MLDQPLDILTINESRLDSSINSQMVEIPGYEVIRKDRNRNGGGVAIYVKSNVNFIRRDDLIPTNLEAVCIEILKPKSKPFLVATWYRPPDTKIELFHDFELFPTS